MKLKFCGAAGTTTGSQHLLEVNGTRILLDCGLFQGRREESYRVNQTFPHFDPTKIDAVVLSHAHIDHSGNLPNLAKNGFSGNIYTTFGTRSLCQVMLEDSARIQESDTKFLNKHRKPDEPEYQPLYTERDAQKVQQLFVAMGYGRAMPIAPGVKLTFFDAGHILGSAQVLLEVDDQEDGNKKRFLFSGDVGRGNNELLPDPVPVENVDYLLMESTYGGREHDSETRADDKLAAILKRALDRGGKIFIPAFAVERTQQLLYILNRLFNEKVLPRVPVFVDSPLAVSATEIFRLHRESFNQEVHDCFFEKQDPFGFDNLTLIRAIRASKELNSSHERAIIISASGMCEAGRILHHLANGIGNEKNTVLFVGYCAQNTLGAKIRNGDKEVNILGNRYKVRAAIETIDSFSGHADNSELLDYFGKITGPKKNVWLIHGEQKASETLASELKTRHDLGEVAIGNLGETVSF